MRLDDVLSAAVDARPITITDTLDAAKLFCDFNRASGDIIRKMGKDHAGSLIWKLYGSGGLVHPALNTANAKESLLAMRSVAELYRNAFEPHCNYKIGGDRQSNLEQVCYMLWDLDGGLDTAAFRTSYDMESAAIQILTDCLESENESVQESALHALNHLECEKPQITKRLIHRYLSNPGHSHAAIWYAQRCCEGIAQ